MASHDSLQAASALGADRIRIARVIARMNVGGPAVEVSNLMRMLPSTVFEQALVTGFVGEGEADYLDTQANDISVQRVSGLGRALRPLDDIRAFFVLCSAIRRVRPAIVHTHTAKAGALGRLAALTLIPRPRVVHTFHGHVLSGYFPRWQNWLFASIERALARITDELITVGPEVRDDLLAIGIGRRDHFHVIEPGVALRHAPTRSEARGAFGLADKTPVISVVGRLTQIKRPDRMLDAVSLAQRQMPELVVLVAGDGELRESLEARVATDQLPVRFLGWTDDVETVFAASDLTLLTSDNEGTPISLMQAALLGVPAVATNVGSVKHVVLDGVTGWLTDPNASAIATSLAEAFANPATRLKRGAAAREHVSENYSVERFISLHRSLYHALIHHR